ncbi:MAG TPA: ATP-binding protein, partial [Micavibrio sp.]
ALTALIGYTFDIEAAYGWWSLSNIAPQTAVGFFFQGLGLIFFGVSRGRVAMSFREKWKIGRWPALAAITGIIITLATAQAILDQGRERTETLAKSEASKIAYVTELGLKNKLRALGRMSARWEMRNGTPLDEWALDAANFVKDNPSYDSLGLMDENFTVFRALPEINGEYWKGVDFNRQELEKASGERIPFITRLSRGGMPQPALAIFQPLFQNGKFYGFLVTAYNPGRELAEILKVDQGNLVHYEIFDSSGLLASNFDAANRYTWMVPHESGIQVRNMPFRIKIGLDARKYENGGIIFIIFIAGLGMSILLANGMYKADELRRIASRLRESDERYAQTVEGAEVALWDWDIEKGRIMWTGMAWHIFGVSSNDYVPTDEKEVRARIPAEDNEALNKIIAGDLEKGDSFNVEFRVRQPSGKYIWVQSRGKAVERRRGEVLRAIGIFSDVTDRRIAEDQLRRTNDELEQFAYIASHDLKAPLRGIDNLAKWILEDLSAVMTDDAREKMDLLRGRVSRLEMLLEDILQYSRAGRIADDPVEINTAKMIRQLMEDRPLPEGFRLELPKEMPVVISSHTPLEQIFMNLISNACKHHDRTDGVIRIEAIDRGMFYEFAVVDDGPGISPQFHERIFKMFQTLKPRDDKESSGLGLSIVKKLVEWQGGRVWVVSEAGKRGTA